MVTASTGRECLTLAEQTRPNLILLDIAMPEMNGWQVAQRLHGAARERAAILILSANPIDPARLAGAERLHDDYLMKPIDLRQLLKKVHALLNIEWLYEEEVAPAGPRAGLPEALSNAAPPDRDIDELIGLGEIGHVRRIHEKLSMIANEAPECASFVARMRAFMTTFDMKHYVAALEAIRNRHA